MKINEIIKEYVENNSESAAKIILKEFQPLVVKYLSIIRWGRRSTEVRVSYFLSAIDHPKGNMAALGWVNKMAARFPRDEIEQEIKISLLQTLKERSYLQGYFEVTLAKNIKELFGPFDEPLPLSDQYWQRDDLLADGILPPVNLSEDEENLLQLLWESKGDVPWVAEQLGVHRRTIYRRLRIVMEKTSEGRKGQTQQLPK
jgi:hypothetical protein